MELAARNNTGKAELGYLLSLDRALVELARVFSYGASKYERGNYLKGAPTSQHVDSLLRHLLAWHSGEDKDPESGCPHLAHAAWNLLRLLQESLVRPELDDRLNYKR